MATHDPESNTFLIPIDSSDLEKQNDYGQRSKMEQDLTHGGQPSPLDSTGLCLLSLDGGGVRGLSTLIILRRIMNALNDERKKFNLPAVKPCEVFDLIGGTSTGGLIAIMLGRLGMDVEECIATYTGLAAAVFGEKQSNFPVNLFGNVRSRFDSRKLEDAIKKVITQSGASETELFNDGVERGCRTFVCSVDCRNICVIDRLRSYSLDNEEDGTRATICEAALATSAAPTFFDPVEIENRTLADGGFGANNPVNEVEGEAANIWCSGTRELKRLVKCFISIGTGKPGMKAFEKSIGKFLSKTVVQIATDTQATERIFADRWAKHLDDNRYFRFDVDQGLEDIGLDEYKRIKDIDSASRGYLTYRPMKLRVRDCIENLRLKESKTTTDFSYVIHEHDLRCISRTNNTSQIEALWVVPFQRNKRFVGRNTEITQINDMLSSQTYCERVALFGLGGVGKTQLALEYSYQLRERQPDCSVFWIPVTSIESMLEGYLEVGRQLHIPNLEQENTDVQKIVHRRLCEEKSRRWLLVFDNADDTGIWTDRSHTTAGSSRRITDLPHSKYGSILFTTRSRRIATRLAGENIVLVGELEKSVAKELLERSLSDPNLLTDGGIVIDLLQKLTFLPLAIVQAAAYINATGITLTEYVMLLDDTEENRVELLSEDFEDEGRYEDTKNPVAATWLVSFEQIRTHHPLAADYLSFMSCVDAKDIPQSLLPPAESTKKGIDAIGTLTAYSFATKHTTSNLLDLHRLVHLATRNWLRLEGALADWEAKAFGRLEEIFPNAEHANRMLWRMYLSHARHVLQFELEGTGNQKTELLSRFGNCVLLDGRYKEAEKAFVQVVEIRKRVLGQDHPNTLTSMGNLASTFRCQGRWTKAEQLEVQVLETSKRVLGQDHPNTLTIMGNLASTFRDQGRWTESEQLEVQVLKKSKTVLGPNHLDTLTSMGNLASTFRGQDRWAEAEQLEVQVLEVTKKMLGLEHPDTLMSMANLASTFWNQEQYMEAEQLEVKVLEISKKVLGAEHPDTLASMGNLASIFRCQGRWMEAEQLGVQVLETSKKVLGPEHPDTLTSMTNLVYTFRDQGRFIEAEQLEVQAVELSKKVLGLEHPDTLARMSNLASRFRGHGRWTEAEQLEMQVLEVTDKVLGPEHPNALMSMANLASTFPD